MPTEKPTTEVEEHRRIIAPNVLAYGNPGGGKTHMLRTALDISPTAQLFVIHTEAPGIAVLGDLDPERYHFRYIPPVSGDWGNMLAEAKEMANSPWDVMKDKTGDTRKKNYTGYYDILKACQNFKCDHCGKEFGDVSLFPEDWTLALDSLSGLNEHCMQGTIGAPIAMSQPQWGVAMKTQMKILNKICLDTNGMFVLTAHATKTLHELSGAVIVRPNAIGQANSPEIPKNFTDIFWVKREGKVFSWSTDEAKADLKPVNLPISSKILPTLVPLFKYWQERTKGMR